MPIAGEEGGREAGGSKRPSWKYNSQGFFLTFRIYLNETLLDFFILQLAVQLGEEVSQMPLLHPVLLQKLRDHARCKCEGELEALQVELLLQDVGEAVELVDGEGDLVHQLLNLPRDVSDPLSSWLLNETFSFLDQVAEENSHPIVETFH